MPTLPALNPNEITRLLEAPQIIKGKLIIQLRDRAVLELLLSCGLKVAELVALKCDSLKTKNNTLLITKKSKARLVPLSHQAIFFMAEYLKVRKDKNDYLLIAHDRAESKRTKKHIKLVSLTPRSIERIVQYYGKVAKITRRLTPSTLRRTFATRYLQNGSSLAEVQKLLGHLHRVTTQKYQPTPRA